MNREDVVLARAYLLRVAEPPAIAVHGLIATHGPVRAAELVRAGEVSPAVARETSARRDIERARQDLELAASAKARLVIPEDEEWPTWRLHSLELAARRAVQYGGAPLALWVRGRNLDALGDHSVTIVGSRAASSYGERVATEFGYGLSAAGIGIVSGAAYGIDRAAHRGALASGGATVAVLACGIDLNYPVGNTRLLDEITEHGCVISEYPPSCPPARHRFLVRNRLLAALGDATVVVEAGRRSGSRNTAATAQALGREVMAVPGSVESSTSVGCNAMLRSGDAIATSSVREVLESVGGLGAGFESSTEGSSVIDRLDPESARVFDALDWSVDKSTEQLVHASGIPVDSVRASLPMLELSGLAVRTDLGWRKVH